MRQAIVLLAFMGPAFGGEFLAQQQPVAAELGRGAIMPSAESRQTIPSLGAVPPEAQGTLQIEAVVGPAGTVLHTVVVSSPDSTGALDRAAVAAVQSWTFRPAIYAGGPVATLVRIDFDIQPAATARGASRAAVRLSAVSRDLLPDALEALAAAKTVTPGNGIQPPRVIREIRPSYTSNAMRDKTMGSVEMDVVVKTDGTVGAVRVTKSLHSELDREALIAARYWLFEPGRLKGEPVAVKVTLELTFRLH